MMNNIVRTITWNKKIFSCTSKFKPFKLRAIFKAQYFLSVNLSQRLHFRGSVNYYPLKIALNLWLRTTASTQQPAMELNPVLSANELLPLFVRALRVLCLKKIFSAF